MDNILSIKTKKLIISFIEEKIKLELIKYNKNLQNKFNISIINYKVFSGKYQIIEKNPINNIYHGKIYNSYTDKIIFEGEYLKGKKNGKGIEYYEDKKHTIKYEGEYLNGKRNGKGKEYYENGNLKFIGEYLNGKKWTGKGFNDSNELLYKIENGKGIYKDIYRNSYGVDIYIFGEYLNGELNGKGIEYYCERGTNSFNLNDKIFTLRFEGEYLNGKRNGKGKVYHIFKGYKDHDFSDNFYEIEYLNGKMWNGKICDDKGNIIFEIKNGKGIFIETEKCEEYLIYTEYYREYVGEYLNGKKNGKGKEFMIINGRNFQAIPTIFEGEYLNNERKNGIEKIGESSEFLNFEGEYLYNHKIKGKEYYYDGEIYEGEYLYDKKWNGKGYNKNGEVIYELINGNGKVKEYKIYKSYCDKHLIFEGEYINGKIKKGIGYEYNEFFNLLKFEGEYLNGERNGKGKKYYFEDVIKFEGEYLNNKKWNGKYYNPYEKNFFEIHNGKGNIKSYYLNDEQTIRKEGYLLNGERNGIWKEYSFYGNLVFEGEYLNGKRNGKGKEYNNEELIFEGEYLNGKRNGKGKEYYKEEILKFEGEYLNGKYKTGKLYNYGDVIFEGEFIEGIKWKGKGKIYYESNKKNNEKYFEGIKIKEEEEDDYCSSGHILFEGEYLEGEINGKGKEFDYDGDLIFEGEYVNGKRKQI